MSRIGSKIINIPAGVTLVISSGDIVVTGSKGSIRLEIPRVLELKQEVDKLEVVSKRLEAKALHGLYRTLIDNAVSGVSKNWIKELELVGVGYKANASEKELTLQVGFSHPVKMTAPEGITFSVVDNTKVIVSGVDKYLVGEVAAKIRRVKPPEPYKGKGIRYKGEYVRKKIGKAAKAVGTAGGGK